MTMRLCIALFTAGYIATGFTVPARAIGCISGGVAGAVAGHMVHHGVLGAVGGCIAGHHYGKQQKTQNAQSQNSPPHGYDSDQSAK
ncbi:MAG TPA: hypothetical protein VGM32_03640 [Rhodopila sp.]|jgi:hypothetical protein